MPQPTTEALHPDAPGLHALPGTVALERLLAAQVAALQSVRPAISAIDAAGAAAAEILRQGGRLAYAGAGSSGLMALADCLELPGTFGIDPARTPVLLAGGAASLLHMTGAVEDDPAMGLADLDAAGLGPGDAVLCISASGTTPYTVAIAETARGRGVLVIAIANRADAALFRFADHAILLDTGPEVVAGSTRMGAGTAQKVALNMLSVRMAIALGHVYAGRMVNLVADNAKLRRRAAGMVADIANVPESRAEAALAMTAGSVKPAILVARGMTPAAANAALTASGGHLGPPLAMLN
jgi:N-acetylmuramic acid 6-phosphate etherase